MEEQNFVQDIIEEIPAVDRFDDDGDEEIDEDNFTFVENDFEDDEDNEEYIHIDDTTAGVERIVDVLGGIFVNADGDTICDVLTNLNNNMEKQNKILYKISQLLASK